MSSISYNWFDIAIIIVIGISVIISLFRGFFREAISLITWIIAIFVALKFAHYFSEKLVPYINSAAFRYIIAFVAIFFVVMIIGAIVSALIGLLIDTVGVGFADRILGAIFGVGRGILLISVALMMIYMSALKSEDWVKNSQLAPKFQPIVDWLNKFLPEQIKEVSEWVTDNVKDIAIQNINDKVTKNVRNSGANSK